MSKKQTEDNPDLIKKQDIPVIITPLYPFRQGQKDARNGIAVNRREWDEYQGLIISTKRLTQKEQERFNQLNEKWAYKRDPLTGQEIHLIEQTVGSVSMYEVRAFLIEYYHSTRDELNNLTWYVILNILNGVRALRRMKERRPDLAGEPKKDGGVWSKPMSKSLMRSTLGIENEHKFNAYAKSVGIKPAGNRQTWQLRLDTLSPKDRSKMENVEV
jgi:hypothetical protein